MSTFTFVVMSDKDGMLWIGWHRIVSYSYMGYGVRGYLYFNVKLSIFSYSHVPLSDKKCETSLLS